MVAVSLEERTISADALPPSKRVSAPTMIDFPAPVISVRIEPESRADRDKLAATPVDDFMALLVA